MRLLFALLLIQLGSEPKLFGQTDSTRSGTLGGVVRDSAGHPIRYAGIWVGTAWAGHADSVGQFSVTGLPPGPHTVFAASIGYCRAQWDSVVVPTGSQTELSFSLRAPPCPTGLPPVRGAAAEGHSPCLTKPAFLADLALLRGRSSPAAKGREASVTLVADAGRCRRLLDAVARFEAMTTAGGERLARAFVVSIAEREYHVADFSDGRDLTYVFDRDFKLLRQMVGLD